MSGLLKDQSQKREDAHNLPAEKTAMYINQQLGLNIDRKSLIHQLPTSLITKMARAGKSWRVLKWMEAVNHAIAQVISKKESPKVMTPRQQLPLWLRLIGPTER